MRPTKLILDNGEIINKSEWKTMENWLHWDLNPWTFETSAAGYIPNPNREVSPQNPVWGTTRVQGLLNFLDCPEENGGYHTVPGFNQRFFDWARDNEHHKTEFKGRNFVDVPVDDLIRKEIVKIPMRAGSLFIWNSQLPHGNYPNDSHKFRMVQYIKMIPADNDGQFHPVFYLQKCKFDEWVPANFEVSDLGMKLFGMESWHKS